ncbi:hypothetical protein ACQX0N_10680 [Clostridium tepidum]|jgi:magnesium-transporting ATPase (P-type)|uniref:ABC transporter permease n=1 Tax=Clostridium tepidum TaxID=1962263 RepID=A0A1S9I4S1_9CLOT|nr:hypothetical protein [Clostridium tepidum]MCR1934696.1 hypothetical protein [Clostridium tepidum]MDU6878871.1 hypothetical protein [Clostridium botulinum]OOO62428.1 hypothetical protein BS637_06180 [Clostridium tepidum]OOO65255.1 hypothetical protein BS638_08945 [Clostridium tepidum]
MNELFRIYGVSKIENNKAEIIDKVNSKNLKYIYILFSILSLLVLYDILNSYKKIGIKKLVGYSNLDIWKEVILKFMIIQISSMIISTVFMIIFLVDKYNSAYLKFLKKLGLNYFFITIAIMIIISIPYVYIQTIKMSSILKNRRQTKEILIFNNLIKVGLIILLNIQNMNYNKLK